MSFTSRIKDEIIQYDLDVHNKKYLLTSFIKYSSRMSNGISLTFDKPNIARFIYNEVINIFGIKPSIVIRTQKRFETKTIYILNFVNNYNDLIKSINMRVISNKIVNDLVDLKTFDEKNSYLKGAFLSCGSISDPKTSGYHLEFVFQTKKDADFISNILHENNINSKVIKRTNKYMVYIKASEEISDILKIFNANKSLFYFEDIRTQKDHINMVNRLNNCEQANQDKIIQTGMKQVDDINYIKENDLTQLLDEKTRIVISYREKYPELSYKELADIISLESGFKISKSGINHHFIKVRELIKRHKK